MRIILTSLFFLVLALCAGAQSQFETSIDKKGQKVFKGILSRENLSADTSFKWFADNLKGYTPNGLAQTALKQYGDSIQLVVFMGTWCEDSHVIIPKLFSLMDASGFNAKRLTLLGTDREKKTLGNLSEAMNVKNVPTIIVMKNGKELGRVVEYGKYGMWDKEMGELINAGF